jgi:hypothetical protein
MLDAIETTGLDAIQLQALRKADTVSFFHRPKPDATNETSYASATKRAKPSGSDPFARDVSIVIPCEWRLTDYTDGYENRIEYGSDAFNAFEMIHSAQHEAAWQTTASLLRVGDKLTLLWERGAVTTQHMKEASPKFFGDRLSLLVTRGERQLTFHIDTRVCEDNSARMIRRA